MLRAARTRPPLARRAPAAHPLVVVITKTARTQVCVGYGVDRLFVLVEWVFYREALYYLDSVRRSARLFVFGLLTLPWFTVVFRASWCSTTGCSAPTADASYVQATQVRRWWCCAWRCRVFCRKSLRRAHRP